MNQLEKRLKTQSESNHIRPISCQLPLKVNHMASIFIFQRATPPTSSEFIFEVGRRGSNTSIAFFATCLDDQIWREGSFSKLHLNDFLGNQMLHSFSLTQICQILFPLSHQLPPPTPMSEVCNIFTRNSKRGCKREFHSLLC